MALSMQVDLGRRWDRRRCDPLTGLSDFGDDSLPIRLAVMSTALDADSGLSGSAVTSSVIAWSAC